MKSKTLFTISYIAYLILIILSIVSIDILLDGFLAIYFMLIISCFIFITSILTISLSIASIDELAKIRKMIKKRKKKNG